MAWIMKVLDYQVGGSDPAGNAHHGSIQARDKTKIFEF